MRRKPRRQQRPWPVTNQGLLTLGLSAGTGTAPAVLPKRQHALLHLLRLASRRGHLIAQILADRPIGVKHCSAVQTGYLVHSLDRTPCFHDSWQTGDVGNTSLMPWQGTCPVRERTKFVLAYAGGLRGSLDVQDAHVAAVRDREMPLIGWGPEHIDLGDVGW